MGVQKARTEERSIVSGGWHCTASGSQKNAAMASVRGVELWLDIELPINDPESDNDRLHFLSIASQINLKTWSFKK